VEALRPERSLSRHPIFQTMFVLQNTPRRDLSWSELVVTVEQSALETSKFDLLLSLDDSGEEIHGCVNYDIDLFDETSVSRWVECLVVLLEAMVQGEARRIDELPILSAPERRGVIEGFNATAASYPKDRLIHELFEEQAARTPAAEAVRHEGRALSYAQLEASANRLAAQLLARGVGPNGLVGICAERSVEMVIGVLAILKAGGAYLPLDPNYPAERLQYMLEDAAPLLVLTQAPLLSALPPTSAPVLTIEALLQAPFDAAAPSRSLSARDPRNLVYVIYTSGSTGHPKGTAMSHGAMVNLIEWHRRSLPLSAGQRVLQFAALSFDVAFQEIFSTLCTGGTLVMLDEYVRRDARALLQLLEAQSIERLFVPPLMLQSLAECFKAQPSVPRGLKEVITAGEQLRISPEIIELFRQLPGCRLHNHYGPTETHVVTALTLTGEPSSWPALPSIGRPIANTQIYLLDGHRQPVPVGVSAEIYIAGANVARGYLDRAALTEARFVRDPFSADPQARMYRTGDVGRWRADGTIEYLGRNDDQVKLRGYRIELGEIERQLARYAAVREAAVIAREDVPGEKRLVAYVTLRAGDAPSVEQLRAHLKSALPDYMVPSAFVTLEQLPLTPSGKLDRRSLPLPPSQAYASERYEAPDGEIEQTLAQIWQDLLQLERVGRQDDFFDLGGHSLLATQVIARLESAFSVEMPMRYVFTYPCLNQLAEQVHELRRTQLRERLAGGGEELEALLARVSSMSDDSAEELVAQLSVGANP
jgi:amino acid adenylation domain-containing protein